MTLFKIEYAVRAYHEVYIEADSLEQATRMFWEDEHGGGSLVYWDDQTDLLEITEVEQ